MQYLSEFVYVDKDVVIHLTLGKASGVRAD